MFVSVVLFFGGGTTHTRVNGVFWEGGKLTQGSMVSVCFCFVLFFGGVGTLLSGRVESFVCGEALLLVGLKGNNQEGTQQERLKPGLKRTCLYMYIHIYIYIYIYKRING